jgi:hypothetical protein
LLKSINEAEMRQESAEVIALKALGWLLGDSELLSVFQGSSGVSETEIRAGASDPAFLGAVLDFVNLDDKWVMAFCDAEGLAYDMPMMARQALPGGSEMHWT